MENETSVGYIFLAAVLIFNLGVKIELITEIVIETKNPFLFLRRKRTMFSIGTPSTNMEKRIYFIVIS